MPPGSGHEIGSQKEAMIRNGLIRLVDPMGGAVHRRRVIIDVYRYAFQSLHGFSDLEGN
jgi:hypothetical protein